MKTIKVILLILTLTVIHHFGIGQCSVDHQHFSDYPANSLMSNNSSQWSIVDPEENVDAEVVNYGEVNKCLLIAEKIIFGEVVTSNDTYVRYYHDDPQSSDYEISLSLHVPVESTGAKLFFIDPSNTILLGVFLYDNGTGEMINNDGDILNYSYPYGQAFSFRINISNGFVTLYINDNNVGTISLSGLIGGIEFCSDNGDYYVCDICIDEEQPSDLAYDEEITCGQTVLGDTRGKGNDIEAGIYAQYCDFESGSSFIGEDYVYRFSKPNNSGDLGITLYHSINLNLTMFLFDALTGDQISCERTNPYYANQEETLQRGETYYASNLPAGDYYIVIDGANTTQEGPYSITVTCEDLDCSDATLIACGETISDNNFSASNDISFIPCFDYRGGIGAEKLYEFTLTKEEDITITLDNFGSNEDFELFLFGEGCLSECIAKSTHEAGLSETINETLSPGTYYILVEGWKMDNSLAPTTGDYELTLSGCSLLCDKVVPHSSESENNLVSFENHTGFDIAYYTVSYPYTGNVNDDFTFTDEVSPDEVLGLSYYCPQPGCYLFCFYYYDRNNIRRECCVKYCAEYDRYECDNKPYLAEHSDLGNDEVKCIFQCGYDGPYTRTTAIDEEYISINGEAYIPDNNGIVEITLPYGEYEVCCYVYDEACDYYDICCTTYCFPYISEGNKCTEERIVATSNPQVYQWDRGDGFLVEYPVVTPNATIETHQNGNEQITTLTLPEPGSYQVCYYSDTESLLCCEYICWDGTFPEDDDCIDYQYVSSNEVLFQCASDKKVKYWTIGCYCPPDVVCICEDPEKYYGEKAIIPFDEEITYTICKVYEECCGETEQCCIDFCYERFDPTNHENCGDIEVKDIGMNNQDVAFIKASYQGADPSGEWVLYQEGVEESYLVVASGHKGANVFMSGFGFIPGTYYYLCYKTIGEDLCPEYCCIKIYIPHACNGQTISPQMDDDGYSYAFNFTGEENMTPLSWTIEGNLAGYGSGCRFRFPDRGNYKVCLWIWDSISRCYVLCCKEYCIEEYIYCGESRKGDTRTSTNDFDDIQDLCNKFQSFSFSGGDDIFAFYHDGSETTTLRLDHGAEDNLTMWIIDGCDENKNCIGSGTNIEDNSGNIIGEEWISNNNLPGGLYYVIIDGATSSAEYEGPYTLTVDCHDDCIDPDFINPDMVCPQYIDPVCGCNGVTYQNSCEAQKDGVTRWTPGRCSGLVCDNPLYIYSEEFEGYNIGDDITQQNTSLDWEIGNCLPNGVDLEGIVDVIDNNKVLALNYGNYDEGDVILEISNNPQGTYKIEFDAGYDYESDEVVYDAEVKIPLVSNLNYTSTLILRVGNTGPIGQKSKDLNFAKLILNEGISPYKTERELADLPEIYDVNNGGGIEIFNIRFIIDADSGEIAFYLNNQLRYSGYTSVDINPNSYSPFGVEFVNHDRGQSAIYVDNIWIARCDQDDCYEDDISQHCDQLRITGIEQYDDDEVLVSVVAEGNFGVEESPEWVVKYSVNGGSMQEELTEITGRELSRYRCIPGRTYYFCYSYYDELGCRRYCCIKLDIPISCNTITPYYQGSEGSLDFNYQVVLNNDESVSSWYIEGDNTGSDAESTYTYESGGTYYVCCLIWDNFRKCYRLCCRKVCIEDPNDCDKIDINFDPSNDEYILTAIGVQEVISWNIDIPTNLPNNGYIGNDNPQRFDPDNFNIGANEEIVISVRYVDSDGCVKVCCRRLCYRSAINDCGYITYEKSGNEGSYTFDFDNSDADPSADLIWSIEGEEMNTSSSNPDFDLSEYIGQNITCCVYYRDRNGCWRYCCVGLRPEGGGMEEDVVFDIGDGKGSPGSIVQIPISVYNFNELSAFELEINTLTSDLISLVSISDQNINGASITGDLPSDSRIIILWENAGQRINIADGTRIMNLNVRINDVFDGEATIFGSKVTVFGDGSETAIIRDGHVSIETSISLSGRLETQFNNPIAGAFVQLSGTESKSTESTQSGEYEFDGLSLGDYKITPTHNTNIKDGINVRDIGLIRNHILERRLLDSPYSIVAADTDRDGKINVRDIGFLRRVILEQIDEFPNGPVWRFIPDDIIFEEKPLLQNIPEYDELPDVNSSLNGRNFTGLKLGDVDNSLESLRDGWSTREDGDTLIFTLSDKEVQPGQSFVIPLSIKSYNDVFGFEFKLLWDSALIRLDSTSQELISFNFSQKDNGSLNILYDDASGQGINLDDGLLTNLHFISDSDASGVTEIRFEKISAFDGNLDVKPVKGVGNKITFSITSALEDLKAGITDLTFFPNPSRNQWSLLVNTRENANLKLKIYDVRGQVVLEQEVQVQPGKQIIPVERSEQLASGVYYGAIYSGEGVYGVKLVRM